MRRRELCGDDHDDGQRDERKNDLKQRAFIGDEIYLIIDKLTLVLYTM